MASARFTAPSLGVLLAAGFWLGLPTQCTSERTEPATAHAAPSSSGKPEGSKKSHEGEKAKPFRASGEVITKLVDFGLQDPRGHEVLHVGYLEAHLDADAMQQSRIRVEKGHLQDLKLLLRKGPSGRTSLAEAFHRGPPPKPAEARQSATQGGMLLDIGPLTAERAVLRIKMGRMPVVVKVATADVSVKREKIGEAPRIHLSKLRGVVASPNPLPSDIDILGGEGTIDLEGEPLVDMRVRVCIANRGELRVHVRVPQRAPDTTHLTVDGDRFMGVTGVGALKMAGAFKDSIEVDRGKVKVPGKGCDSIEN